MRTTLTLEDEVAVGLRRMQKREPGRSFKEIVNETLKKGLAANGDKVNVPFKITPARNAKPKLGLNFDSISSLISVAEGDFHK
ncbi:MAG TPA: hypothetical protein VK612_07330 [Pyrinomonadaceae bacterium]|nr:hypothetical protein [Pyrinomonadaceae bacterium]